jgi:hypothetical protein
MWAQESKNLFISLCVPNAQDAVWYGGFAELDYNPKQLPLWLFIYRYDMIRNDSQGNGTPGFPKAYNDINSHTLMARYYFHISDRTDTTLHLEYNHTDDKDVGSAGGDRVANTLLVGLDFAL